VLVKHLFKLSAQDLCICCNNITLLLCGTLLIY